MVEALLTLKGENAPLVGRDRIRLLQAVDRAGSITGGARAVGLTYKAAWDALDAMAGLFGRPMLDTRVGGRAGGGARLTPAGLRLIEGFGRLEADLARAARHLDEIVSGGSQAASNPVAPVLRTSARNALHGAVDGIRHDALTAEVTVALPDGGAIVARVTGESLRSLGLTAGRAVVALIKASFIEVTRSGTAVPQDHANRFDATVLHCAVAGAEAEVLLDIGRGRTLAATSTAERVAEGGLAAGCAVEARFGAAQVILATLDNGV